VIRPLDAERDAEAVVALTREADPYAVVTVEAWRHRVATIPERGQAIGLVAEADGSVVGNAYALRNFWGDLDNATVNVTVAAGSRRCGIGSMLCAAVLDHVRRLGARTIYGGFFENDAGVRFAEAHGFRLERAATTSVVDSRAVAGSVEADVRPVSDVDPLLVYEIDLETTHDMPSSEPAADMSYAEWEQHVLQHPLFAPDGSYVAFVDGEHAALSLLIADDAGRGANMFTGTRRGFRGRGLAYAVKLATTLWAAEHGVTQIATHNDETNAPMLAVNHRLGYVPVGRRVEVVREGTASSRAPRAPAT
jgi:GNAT superfamily N-acetyltransferase